MTDTGTIKSRRHAWWRVAAHLVILTLIFSVVGSAVEVGLDLRRRLWDDTQQVRFVGDINNGYNWGSRAQRLGIVNLYDRLETQHEGQEDADYRLDYTPLRLFVMTTWVNWTRQPTQPPQYRDARNWNDDYAFNEPLLQLNTACELAGALAVFLLVRLWVVRGHLPGRQVQWWQRWILRKPHPELPLDSAATTAAPRSVLQCYRGVVPGLIGAGIFWFNPAILWEAHTWPQWDVWNLPFYLFALFFACVNWWMLAGMLLAAGATLKGQVLLVAPILVLWPLFQGNWRAAARVVLGFIFSVGCITSPWLTEDVHAVEFVLTTTACAAMLMPWIWARAKPARWWISATVATATATWLVSGLLPPGTARWIWTLPAMALVVAGLRFLPRRAIPYMVVATAAAALWLCVPLFNGRLSWYHVGFQYPTRHFLSMTMGPAANMPALLSRGPYNWQLREIAWIIPTHQFWLWPAEPHPLEIKYLLFSIYAVALVLCSIGAAIHDQRRDPRFLAAVVAPWVLFFSLLCQMHERYLIWGAGTSALLVALGVGPALLSIIISLFAWSMMACCMMPGSPEDLPANFFISPQWTTVVHGANPGIAWGVMLAALVLLYWALAPSKRRLLPVEPSTP